MKKTEKINNTVTLKYRITREALNNHDALEPDDAELMHQLYYRTQEKDLTAEKDLLALQKKYIVHDTLYKG